MNRILIGDCRDKLKTLSDKSVHCCVTSPPYWNLRDYGHDSQIGPKLVKRKFKIKMNQSFAEAFNGRVDRRNKRSVWTVGHGGGYKGAHFAIFPPKLIEPCILDGSPESCCSECGKGYRRQVEKTRVPTRPGKNTKVGADDDSLEVGNRDPQRHTTTTKTIGFEPDCECYGAGKSKSVVLDPFAGSGTTAQVAQDNGRNWVMCEANSEYVEMIKSRTKQKSLF